jgi:hypothetical protein
VLGLAAAPGAARAEGEGNQDQESQQEGEASQDAAQEKRDRRNEELRDRVKSVQRKVFVKKDRFEIFPYFGLDLNDPFYQHFIVGGSVERGFPAVYFLYRLDGAACTAALISPRVVQIGRASCRERVFFDV